MAYFDQDAALAPTRWRLIRAINGRGEMLVGPDEHAEQPGAMVIAPPGVMLRAPHGGQPLTRTGWRQARWRPNRHGHVLIDQGRPFALEEVSLLQVVEDLADWAPSYLNWVADVVARKLRVQIGQMRPDSQGRKERGWACAYEELVKTKNAADDAFARLRGHPCQPPEWMISHPFTHLVKAYIITVTIDQESTARNASQASGAQIHHLRLVHESDRPASEHPRQGL